jgi:hypothetical protein
VTIRFKTPRVEKESKALIAGLWSVLVDFDVWGETQGLPDPMVTCIHRTESENKAAGGVASSLHLAENPYRAMDLRSTHYDVPQLMKVDAWFRGRCLRALFEVITKPHGTGPHIHVGLRRPDPNPKEVS